MGEIAAAAQSGNADDLEDEVGDLLFMAVNVARYLKVHPEIACAGRPRIPRPFRAYRTSLAAQERTLDEASLDEMEALWQEAKGG
jgi:ATP diphosphatase